MSEEKENPQYKRLETWCGLLLAVFAAALAITDLGGSRYGDDEIMGTNEKNSTYMWYQSKSIKENLAEGNRDLLSMLLETGVIGEDKRPGIEKLMGSIQTDVDRYKKEKKEILLGSAKVGKENWVQDIGGEYGKVIGVKEWEEKLAKLGEVGDYFDDATLFLQLCLVMGAITLITPSTGSKRSFFIIMVVLGVIGVGFTTYAFSLVP